MAATFPPTGLPRCVEFVQQIWDKEKRTAVSREVMAKAMGYGSLNGAARTQLSALKQFGLIDSDSPGIYRLSDLAVLLMAHPVSSMEYQTALRKAALTPDLFREMQGTYPQASDEAIRAHLITKKDFSDDAARSFIKSFRETMKFAKPRDAQTDEGFVHRKEPDSLAELSGSVQSRTSRPSEIDRAMVSKTAADLWALGYPAAPEAEQPGVNELRLNISRDTRARIIFSGPVTQEAIEKLAALLELQKDTFPSREELEAAEAGSALHSNGGTS